MPIVPVPGSLPQAAGRGAARGLEPWYDDLPEQAMGVVNTTFRAVDTPGRYTRAAFNWQLVEGGTRRLVVGIY